jgi:hypothetical protein
MAETVVGPERTVARDGSEPYRPSWVNVLNEWFEQLPGPTWLAYLVAIAAGVVFMYAAPLIEPNGPPVEPFQMLYYGALPFAVLGLIGSLDRTAGRALATLRPLLRLSDAELADARRNLTVAPARPALLITIFAVAVTPVGYILDPVGSGVVGYGPLGLGARWAWEALVTAVFLILVYHTFRQLRLIGRLHESIPAIDLFDQSPLYALSSMTSLTAVGLILLLVPSVFLIPAGAGASYILISAGWYGFTLVVSISAFFLPLRGIHGRIAGDKARLRGEVGRRMSGTLEAIHRAVDAGDAQAVTAGHQALSALTAERDLIAKVPTWPWSGGALVRFLSAVLLPIGLWLITRFLERIV